MNKGDLLFVYGTLRRGEKADLSKGARWGEVSFICEDRINGNIYDLGWYPGAKVDVVNHFDENKSTMFGDVFKIKGDTVVHVLDAYEGYPTLFDRVETKTASGLSVHVYVYNHTVDERNHVASGDWSSRAFRSRVA